MCFAKIGSKGWARQNVIRKDLVSFSKKNKNKNKNKIKDLIYIIYIRVMLMSTLRSIINKSFLEKFDTTLMKNIKNCQNI